MRYFPKARCEKILTRSDQGLDQDVNIPVIEDIYFGTYQGEFFKGNYKKPRYDQSYAGLNTKTYSGVYSEIPLHGLEFYIDAKPDEVTDLRTYLFVATVSNRFGMFRLLLVYGDTRPYFQPQIPGLFTHVLGDVSRAYYEPE